MRKWRVGTISMGLALIFLGALLMVGQFTEWDPVTLTMSWWPFILIVLGVEVLVYIVLSKKEKPVVQYDILSIFFIGVLGTVAIGLYLMTSLGLVNEVKGAMHTDWEEGSLPSFKEKVTEEIDTVILEESYNDLAIETNNARELHIFGTFRSDFQKSADIEKSDVASVNVVGDKMYIRLLQGASKDGLYHSRTFYNRTISLPEDVDVEIRGSIGDINLNTGTITGDWMIDEARSMVLDLPEEANVTVRAESYSEQIGWDVNWDQEETIGGEEEKGEKLYYKEKVFGDGEATIQVNLIDQFTIKDVGPRS
ncbi:MULTISPECIES: LiaF transmembrane domain-containing protein [Pontibacillus]|uniref:DUF5668 domain-containing protein n=1 Tax=Pontibacillus chungwhensis TaxID=265426 RepID=A0ABY8UY60_9BACI|nr:MULTISPECIES: hypothetical protein [Pontibacillus]MCD5325469.1 hypothetical protein [Pontibacillus sp. HN14]WIF98582.1 hypothetical protein QNI29_02620 [Pontibacillus chungwhensis]